MQEAVLRTTDTNTLSNKKRPARSIIEKHYLRVVPKKERTISPYPTDEECKANPKGNFMIVFTYQGERAFLCKVKDYVFRGIHTTRTNDCENAWAKNLKEINRYYIVNGRWFHS